MASAEEQYRAAAEAIATRNVELRCFLLRLIDPGELGWAVTIEVRQEAARLLGLETNT